LRTGSKSRHMKSIAVAFPTATAFAMGSEPSSEGNCKTTAEQFDKVDQQTERNKIMKTRMVIRLNKRVKCSMNAHDPRTPKVNGSKQILMGLVLAVAVMLTQPLMAAGPAPIDLKSCSHFAILAASTITSTGGGIINGDVGLSPAGSQGIPPAQINGTIYNGGLIAAQAQLDLNDAIIAASPAQLPGGIDVGNGELGGRVLAPGVYKSAPGSYDITLVDLTLNGGPNDVWVFQMASTLTVGVGRQVILTGGAQARNIFWQVGSSATLQTSSVFKGTIMAYASITMNASSTMDGRALAQAGAVTFNGTSGKLPPLRDLPWRLLMM
jgi:hypothetical protein